ITTATPSYAAAIASCRSTSTCRAARRRPRRCSTASCSCRRRSAAPARSCAEAVMDDKLNDLATHIAASARDAGVGSTVRLGELTLQTTAAKLVSLLTFLRDDPKCLFRQLVDICGADYPERAQRFDVVYHLLSLRLNQRVRVKVATDEDTPVPSAAS